MSKSSDKWLADLVGAANIGKNVPASESAIALANARLKAVGLPGIPEQSAALLKLHNGLSNEGAAMFGAATGSTLFTDLLAFNLWLSGGKPADMLILGYDDSLYLLFDAGKREYLLADRESFEPEASSPDLADLLPDLMGI